MGRRRLALLLLAVALLASTGLRAAAGSEKRGLTHDESISLLAAACHQGDYTRLTFAGEPPFGRWVPASEWKELLRPDRSLCFAEIARDLSAEDIHPPLYFWLLHVWGLAFGVGLWTGLSLNLALAPLTGLALFGLARRALGDPLSAACVAAVWSFSPAAIRVFAEARQYELLALLAVLFVWQCVRICDRPAHSPRRDVLLLVAITAAGALAQFLFALVAAAGAAILLARLWRGRRRALAWALGSIAAGYAVFGLLQPGFTEALRRGGAQAADPAPGLLPGRIDQTVDTFAAFLLPPSLADGAVAYGACALLAAMTAVAIVAGQRTGARARAGDRDAAASRTGEASAEWEGDSWRSAPAMPLVFAWLAAAHTGLFLAFVSPGGAMDFKHVSVLWPFAAFVPVLAVAALPRRARVSVGLAGGAALAASGAVAVLGHFPDAGSSPPLERAETVLIDNVARGVLPRIVWRLPEDARVFAADQRRLLSDPVPWLDELGRGDLYVGRLPPSDPRYGNNADSGRRVAGLVARRHRLVQLPDPLEPGRVMRLEPRHGGRQSRRSVTDDVDP